MTTRTQWVRNMVSTRETSVEADFGRSFRVVAGPRLCTSPRVLASQGVSSLGEPASRRRSPFYCGSGDGPDALYSALSLWSGGSVGFRRPLGCSGDVNRRPREWKPNDSHRPQVRVWRSEQGCHRAILDAAEPDGNTLQ